MSLENKMKRRLYVSYTGGQSEGFDDLLTNIIESIGGEWTGQGMDVDDRIPKELRQRDINFDIKTGE